jgi:2-methylcitrate dehydratase
MLELRKAHAIDLAQIDSIENDVFQDAYDFMGGGSFGPKTDVHTKEQADHSLPYLLAVALLDGNVQPAQLTPERIAKPDVQRLLLKVKVRPDQRFTALYPNETPSRATIRLTTGASYTHEVKDYPGFATRPFTWAEIVAKLNNLATGHADEGLCKEIAEAVRSLESIRVKDLMALLARVGVRPRQAR